jgi:hypothetical protein
LEKIEKRIFSKIFLFSRRKKMKYYKFSFRLHLEPESLVMKNVESLAEAVQPISDVPQYFVAVPFENAENLLKFLQENTILPNTFSYMETKYFKTIGHNLSIFPKQFDIWFREIPTDEHLQKLDLPIQTYQTSNVPTRIRSELQSEDHLLRVVDDKMIEYIHPTYFCSPC